MDKNDHDDPPGLGALVARLAHTGAGLLRNRGELLTVEWQQEKGRLIELLTWTVVLLFMSIMGMILLTATVILLFPEDKRIYVAGGFTLLYLGGAVAALFSLRSLLKREPFQESLEQLKKDVEWLKSHR